MNNVPYVDKEPRIFFVHEHGTFDLDKVDALVPVRVEKNFGLRIIMGPASHTVVFGSHEERDAFRMRFEGEFGIYHEETPVDAAQNPCTPTGPVQMEFDPSVGAITDRYRSVKPGVCAMGGCDHDAAPGSIVCKDHADQLNQRGKVES